ncbi:hypothetical protein Mal4_12900 [Maioricimonas rarisocia]|uniref:Uncharacterized protein n=1 Tax=Maioricimonas rarisocia TaxID=2528026 RepID=A0A517Z3H8_9PLAN|nr:hypothetical protein [Maioricimonas rarisocia]QDU36987.1 hypothetical protein Mal4_12900 [Maioricimonas rarisocia]
MSRHTIPALALACTLALLTGTLPADDTPPSPEGSSISASDFLPPIQPSTPVEPTNVPTNPYTQLLKISSGEAANDTPPLFIPAEIDWSTVNQTDDQSEPADEEELDESAAWEREFEANTGPPPSRARAIALAVLIISAFGVGVGLIVAACILPLHLADRGRDRQLASRAGEEAPALLTCPISGETTDSLKQYRLPVVIVCLGIAFAIRTEETVASPAQMRKTILQSFLFNLPVGNFLTLVMAPSLALMYLRTFERGHSSRLLDPKVGALRERTA